MISALIPAAGLGLRLGLGPKLFLEAGGRPLIRRLLAQLQGQVDQIVIAAPPARVQLSRKQILQNEIRNEQAALVREQAQLNVAKSKGDKAKVSRLEQAVRDRQANIRAIQGEMGR